MQPTRRRRRSAWPPPTTQTDEANETFTLTLSSPTNATLGTATATGTINDNDETPATPALSVADASATEGAAVVFTVSLSAPASSDQVTVAYATSGGTATSGTDFTAASGTLTFAANETSKTVSVATTDDAADEANETFTLTLSSPTNATLGTATATGTINDDDETPLTASFADVPASHDGSTAFTFTLSFSEDVGGLGYRTLRDSGFDITGGSVTGARRKTEGSDQHWNIKVEPDSEADVVIFAAGDDGLQRDGSHLHRGRPKAVAGGIGDGGRPGGHSGRQRGGCERNRGVGGRLHRVAGTSKQRPSDRRLRHCGWHGDQRNRLHRRVGNADVCSQRDLEDGQRGTTDDAADEANETFTLTLSSPTNATLGTATATGTINDNDDGEVVVPLTAAFQNVPAAHDGSTAFTLQVLFSEALAPGGSGRKLAQALTLTRATRGTVRRVNERRDLYEFPVQPSGTAAVTVSLSATSDCAASDAVCTADGKALSNEPRVTVAYAASSNSTAGDEVEDALALVAGLTPTEATQALFGERSLTVAQQAALDRLGNQNGRFDLGDVRAWVERCRRGEARCGGTSPDAGPAGAALLVAVRGRGPPAAREGALPGLADAHQCAGRVAERGRPDTCLQCCSPRSRSGRARTARWRRPPSSRIRAP